MKKMLFVLSVLFVTSLQANVRIGVVDLSKVLFFYDEFKIFRIEYANRESRYQQELNQEEVEVGQLKQKLASPDISEEEKLKLEKDFSRRMFSLQRKFEQYKKKLDEQKEEELERLKGNIFDEIEQVAKAKKLDFVLDKKQVYFGNTQDFTQEIIEKINKRSSKSKR